MKKKWWHDAVCYQIYPKSFQDSNGDGYGDIRGIINRLDYLKDLGINVIWISPIFQSPMVDHGYDISDYYEIDPMFGTMEDMEELIAEADKRNIKILMDLVINHSSDQHEWFKKAMEDLDGPYADYYIIKEGIGEEPPNNWRSIFGGSAWERIAGTNKYYLHLFTKEQPDLNWENKEVREELYKMVNFWLDKGLGGFRVDAINHIKKDASYAGAPADGIDGLVNAWDMYLNVPGIEKFLHELKERTFKPHDCMTVAEATLVNTETLNKFISEDGYFSSIFDFSYSEIDVGEKGWRERNEYTIKDLRDRLFKYQQEAGKCGFVSEFLENHDQPRVINKFIPKEDRNFYSASMLATMYFFLRGIPFIYQGQEIGMTNYEKERIEEYLDVSTLDNYNKILADGYSEKVAIEAVNRRSREHSRTPMQWDSSENAGFTKGTPWFAVNPNRADVNVSDQEQDPDSLLSYYKKISYFRQSDEWKELFVYGDLIPAYTVHKNVIAYERKLGDKRVLVINNFDSNGVKITLKNEVIQILMNNYQDVSLFGHALEVKPYQSLILEVK